MIKSSSRLVLGIIVCIAMFLNACNLQYKGSPQISQFLDSIKNTNLQTNTNNSDIKEINPPSTVNSEEQYVNFQVQVPENTPPNEIVYLSILDEVTGLALNAIPNPMVINQDNENQEGTQNSQTYSIELPFEIGSIIKYRYERQSGSARVGEHLSDASPVRYRLFKVNGIDNILDVVSRWTDTEYLYPKGRIIGEALDSATSQPIPNLLIAVGGSQTITDSRGSFTIEGLPPGVHILVGYALDGSYQIFQQGARIAPDATTPAHLELSPAEYVDISFKVKVPENTPEEAQIRLAGNLYQLGNSFADLTGGVNTLASRMPVLDRLSKGEYGVTLSLPVGANITYKYTLGDGFWNAEHDQTGKFNLRQLMVPDQESEIQDVVEAWSSSPHPPITFNVEIPATTPPEDYISIQFKPLFGWTEPIPMWNTNSNQWQYTLFSPLNLPGEFAYRYCRNDQCGFADDQITPGVDGSGRILDLSSTSDQVNDQVDTWLNFINIDSSLPEIQADISPRDEDFWAGVELTSDFHPSWMVQMPTAMESIATLGSNWTVLAPSWTFASNSSDAPLLQINPGSDPSWFDLAEMKAMADEQGTNVAVFPTPEFQINEEEWWQTSAHDYSWWLVWFDQVRKFILHHADFAAANEAQALILGGSWLNPALPDGVLPDGTPSGVPADADTRWRELISEVRSRFTGEVLWALPYNELDNLPPFADEFDRIYLLINVSPESLPIDSEGTPEFSNEFKSWLQNKLEPFYIEQQIPIVVALNVPSIPDLNAQLKIYESTLSSIQPYEWINGIISRGYYPPVALQDNSASINGKPAQDLLEYWFTKLFEAPLE